tara:strand:- start:599 stop:2731 length:2133 start_codon:yes stop_codon:yes gene_type:complete
MTVSHEIKSQLAKLLATEDLVVEHKKVETAQFNVHTRVLTLPMWEKASNIVYDMLVGHEVGHALYTPDRNWLKEYNIPPQFVNIVEDARIEKMMKRRYPGLSKTFYGGYKELAEEDFFQVEDEDISLMNLADRANLWFKIGNYTQVPIESGQEQEIIKAIADTETFDDVLVVSEKLYKYCKESMSNNKEVNTDQHNQEQEGQESESSTSSGGQSSGDQVSADTVKEPEMVDADEQQKDELNGEVEEPETKTVDSLEEALKDLISNDGYETKYLEIPDIDINKIIIPNNVIHQACEDSWISNIERVKELNVDFDVFEMPDSKYAMFKKSAQKEVNYLVKEFECRKSADSYARATTSRTGVLDCTKLHTYKYNEDLFKKVTTLADGKNHGLVFVLDWSGSMSDVMLDTIKQLYNLIWFCKKVGIPFDVYAFTSDYPYVFTDEDGKPNIRELCYSKKEGLFHIPEWFSMMNILTSKVNSKELDSQMKSIFRIAHAFGYSSYYQIPNGMSLSGTPLNEALMTLYKIIPQFKKDNNLQKVQCIVLTDGEAQGSKYHKEFNRKWEEEAFLGTIYLPPEFVLRDRKTGHTYVVDGDCYIGFSDALLKNLRQNFMDTNFIGIRVISGRDANSFIRLRCSDYQLREKIMKTWKRERSFVIKTSGYHSYFAISSSSLSSESQFSVKDDATKSQIKSAFVKSLRTKKMNKKILGEFVELIA